MSIVSLRDQTLTTHSAIPLDAGAEANVNGIPNRTFLPTPVKVYEFQTIRRDRSGSRVFFRLQCTLGNVGVPSLKEWDAREPVESENFRGVVNCTVGGLEGS